MDAVHRVNRRWFVIRSVVECLYGPLAQEGAGPLRGRFPQIRTLRGRFPQIRNCPPWTSVAAAQPISFIWNQRSIQSANFHWWFQLIFCFVFFRSARWFGWRITWFKLNSNLCQRRRGGGGGGGGGAGGGGGSRVAAGNSVGCVSLSCWTN